MQQDKGASHRVWPVCGRIRFRLGVRTWQILPLWSFSMDRARSVFFSLRIFSGVAQDLTMQSKTARSVQPQLRRNRAHDALGRLLTVPCTGGTLADRKSFHQARNWPIRSRCSLGSLLGWLAYQDDSIYLVIKTVGDIPCPICFGDYCQKLETVRD